MNCAVGEWVCERLVDELVLLDQRQVVETRARHDNLEVITAAGPIGDGELRGVGKRLREELLKSFVAQVRFVTERRASIPSLR